MDKILKDSLRKKYPKILVNENKNKLGNHKDVNINVGNGWYKVIDDLCNKIQKYIDKNNIEQTKAILIKEKLGILRFYVTSSPDEIYQYIYNAEYESIFMCEICGATEDIGRTKRWISTLCRSCANNRDRIETWKPMCKEDINEKQKRSI